MEWGLPVIENNKIGEEARPQAYGIFEEYSAALEFIKRM